MNTHQSTIDIYETHVVKTYKKNEVNSYSSMEHEIMCINFFSCKYSPQILSVDKENNSYVMKRYDIPFGNTKRIDVDNIKRILFTLSKEELFQQLDEILSELKKDGLNHRDINPGNLIFSEKERVIKLIDFYWTTTPTVKGQTPPGGINGIYGSDDGKAIEKIKNQIDEIFLNVHKSIRNVKKMTEEFGITRCPGSSKHKGKAYSPINIPYFNDITYHRDISSEYQEIKNNLSIDPKIVLDIGCATGYTIFNLLRDFSIKSAIGYEADPKVFEFLSNIKRVFCLDNLELIQGVTPNTIFPQSDLVVCMNVHMWLDKVFGKDCDIIMKNLISSTKELFFQTAGAESMGMYLVKDLDSKEKIFKYLQSLGGKNIKFIRSTKYHGGLRHLFKVTKELK
jgi:serine/threonine protein kinase